MAPQTLGINSDSVTFLESTENLQELDSMSIRQNLSGNFDFAIAENENLSGQFRLGFTSDVINKGNLQSDVDANIVGQLNLHYEGEDAPFENLTAYLNLKVKSIVDDGIYVQLRNLYFNASGIPENEMDDYLESKAMVAEGVASLKDQWIYFPATLIEEGMNMGAPEGAAMQEELREQIAQEGLKETYKQLFSEYMTTSGTIGTNEAELLDDVLDKFFETEFFSRKTVTSGLYKDFERFTFSKRRFVHFVQWIGYKLGVELTAQDLEELNNVLSKFYFSGAYHVDNQNRIFDQVKLKLILKGIEELKKAQFGLFYKVSDVNQIETIKAPSDFKNYEEVDIESLLY
ncbi:hypothetical protein KAR91_02805 [Candidatus Pacearchaeota archaeon]|nr:hypothetical protein [Candidatus Pacearchaeota archaeon]